MSVVLGINAFHAGASAALVVNGQRRMAVAEERLNRVKYYAGFPSLAIRRCLEHEGLTFADIDVVAIGRDTSANRAKKIEYVPITRYECSYERLACSDSTMCFTSVST